MSIKQFSHALLPAEKEKEKRTKMLVRFFSVIHIIYSSQADHFSFLCECCKRAVIVHYQAVSVVDEMKRLSLMRLFLPHSNRPPKW